MTLKNAVWLWVWWGPAVVAVMGVDGRPLHCHGAAMSNSGARTAVGRRQERADTVALCSG